jgi:hypothetical protein
VGASTDAETTADIDFADLVAAVTDALDGHDRAAERTLEAR